jgi:hypothetical protein
MQAGFQELAFAGDGQGTCHTETHSRKKRGLLDKMRAASRSWRLRGMDKAPVILKLILEKNVVF